MLLQLLHGLKFFLRQPSRVEIGSFPHVFPILFAMGLGFLLINYAKDNLSEEKQRKALHLFAIFLSLTIVVFHSYQISLGGYKLQTDLPLYLCSLIALLIPIFTHYRKYWMYEILLFWIIAGTSQGILTPDIADGFPHPDYFRYWIVHLGLVIIILYATVVFKMKPTLKSVFKSIVALQFYVVFMILINYILDANYFYLNAKPESSSLLDYFGDWPFYIIVGQLVLVPYFLLIYLPFYLSERIKTKKS